MKTWTLASSALVTALFCSNAWATDQCGPTIEVVGVAPRNAQGNISIGAHPRAVIDGACGGSIGTVKTSAQISLSKTQSGTAVDGTVERVVEGETLVLTFVPKAPLDLQTSYTLTVDTDPATGPSTTTFTTAGVQDPGGAAPVPSLTVTLAEVDHDSTPPESVYSLSIAAGMTEGIIHVTTQTKAGAKVADKGYTRAVPVGTESALLIGAREDAELCFVGQFEDLLGNLSQPSTPVCAVPKVIHSGGCSVVLSSAPGSSAIFLFCAAVGVLLVGRRSASGKR